MAAHDYIIVAPSRRGVSGFGQAWQEQISGDYHGKSMQDYLTAIDIMAKEPFVDKERLGAVGASAGGHAVFYLAGNHQGRFKAFIAHDGIFNKETQYLETEEMWFVNWDMGGPFWILTMKRHKAHLNIRRIITYKTGILQYSLFTANTTTVLYIHREWQHLMQQYCAACQPNSCSSRMNITLC